MIRFIKYMMVTLTALVCVACTKPVEGDNYDPSTAKKVIIKPSNNLFAADGVDKVVLSVLADDHDVTHLATFYQMEGMDMIELASNEFSTTNPKKYTFWATVKGVKTEMIEPIEVEAIILDIPEAPADPQKSNTSFVQRTLITKFTGTACSFCPNLIQATKFLEEDKNYAGKFVIGACHTFGRGSTITTAPTMLASNLNNGGDYPAVWIGHKWNTSGQTAAYFYTFMQEAIDDIFKTPALAGIAVNSEIVGDIVVATVEIKAAADGDYYLGCWLVEDKIMAVQIGAGSDPIEHNDVIRVDANYEKGALCYMGKGFKGMKSGSTEQNTYKLNMNPEWVKGNCRLVLYASVKEGSKYVVTNAISAPINTSVPYEYK